MERSAFLQTVSSLLEKEHIFSCGCIPMQDAVVLNPHLLPEGMQTVLVFPVPYDCGETYTDGVSAYAHIYDYHAYFRQLYETLLPALKERFPGYRFFGFADHSPVHEKDAAAKAGLGILGCHSLLLHPVYGSYVFLGSVLTDLPVDCAATEVRFCEKCMACRDACPGNAISEKGICPERCLSALSQKKRLSEDELQTLRDAQIAWGCDRCQQSCVHNRGRAYTEIPFFLTHRKRAFSASEIGQMTDEELQRYAFAWRGRQRILSNLQNLEK